MNEPGFSPSSDPMRHGSFTDASSEGTMTVTDMTDKLKKDDEARLKNSTARALPWFFSLLIFLLQLSIFFGFAFFAYANQTV